MIIPFLREAKIADVTADDLNALSRGQFAKGLAAHLLKAAKISLAMSVFIFLFGLITGLFFYPIIFP